MLHLVCNAGLPLLTMAPDNCLVFPGALSSLLCLYTAPVCMAKCLPIKYISKKMCKTWHQNAVQKNFLESKTNASTWTNGFFFLNCKHLYFLNVLWIALPKCTFLMPGVNWSKWSPCLLYKHLYFLFSESGQFCVIASLLSRLRKTNSGDQLPFPLQAKNFMKHCFFYFKEKKTCTFKNTKKQEQITSYSFDIFTHCYVCLTFVLTIAL